jgi:hypothetical protein
MSVVEQQGDCRRGGDKTIDKKIMDMGRIYDTP